MRLSALPRRYAVVGLLVGLLGRAVADCNHNNCLRAVIGSAFPTRDGVGDCNSYLLATVTPATSTFYSTTTIAATASTTTTVVDGFSTVIVIPATTTSTQSTTETQYTVDTVTTATSVTIAIEETITTTSDVATVTVTETNTPAAKARRGRRGQMEPRQVTATPTAIPAYASSCPSPAAYISACLCFGATARTITAAAPSTTITIPTTSYTTSTILSTISTTSTQSSTSTATILETGTTTSTVVESTTDFTTLTTSATSTAVIIGTTTTTITTTATTNSCPSPALQNGGFESGDTITPWVYSNFGYDVSAGVDTASTGGFTPYSGNNYFEVTNDQSSAIEVRLAQSPYFCTGVAYTITFSASGDCNGKSCAGSEDLYVNVATLQSSGLVFYVQTNSQSEYTTFTWTFTWTGGDGLNPVLVDMFITGEGESIAIDNISIGFA